MREISRPVARRMATAAVLALIHVAIIAYFALPQRLRWPLAGQEFVTHVFFLSEPTEEVVQPATPSRASATREVAPLQTAPLTAPPDMPASEEPATPPRLDWAREAEISASRQLVQEDEARRLAAPFSHDFTEPTPAHRQPPFRWSRAHTQRIEQLPSGGTLVRLNDRCVLVFAVMVLPICQIGKIPVHGDLFEHMDDAPVLGEPPSPP
jgi:hypothetical protein